jgi:hypothetical protein
MKKIALFSLILALVVLPIRFGSVTNPVRGARRLYVSLLAILCCWVALLMFLLPSMVPQQ